MGWMMKRQMGKLCDEVCEDLRMYIETGRPSNSKQAAIAQRPPERWRTSAARRLAPGHADVRREQPRLVDPGRDRVCGAIA